MLRTVLACSLLVTVPALAAAGEVKGRVVLSRPAPGPATVPTDKDRATCGEAQPAEAVVVSSGGLEQVVVRIEVPGAKAPPRPLTLDQRGCRYLPRVQVASPGSVLTLRNGDPVLHNVHGWAGPGTAFNVAMPMKGGEVARPLTRAGVVRIECDIHAWMEAFVLVAETPYVAVTGAGGAFAIAGVPEGSWQAVAWHERFGEKRAIVTVPAAGPARLELEYP